MMFKKFIYVSPLHLEFKNKNTEMIFVVKR